MTSSVQTQSGEHVQSDIASTPHRGLTLREGEAPVGGEGG